MLQSQTFICSVFIALAILVSNGAQECGIDYRVRQYQDCKSNNGRSCPYSKDPQDGPQTFVFPDITINCTGTVETIVSVVGKQNPPNWETRPATKIQIWRKSADNIPVYNLQYSVSLNNRNCSISRNEANCNFEFSVITGDVVGLMIPMVKPRFSVHFGTEERLPFSYSLNNTIVTHFSEHNWTKKNIIPLISFATAVENNAMMTEGTTESKFGLDEMKRTTKGRKIESDKIKWAIGLGVLLLSVLLGIIVVCIVCYMCWRHKRSSARTIEVKIQLQGNPTYSLAQQELVKKDSLEPSKNYVSSPRYHFATASVIMNEANHDYSEVEDHTHTQCCSSTGGDREGSTKLNEDPLSNSVSAYETPLTTDTEQKNHSYFVLEWEQIVPSNEQRAKTISLGQNKISFGNRKEQHLCSAYEVAHTSFDSQMVNFFEECENYWEPSSNASELYEQLSKKKYREIPSCQLKLFEVLGSGAFGIVNKGLWQSPGGAMEVAVKTIQNDSEEEKVKFLQEAAIMGQFRHPNVVKLMGVVTVGEPAMVVLELLSHGDLRNFLIEITPKPGEMVPSDTPALLLKFCQQISCGMEYLARKAFVHRDLAARNILVSGDKCCKISDFGMSRDLMDENYYISQGGKIPVKWTAPEAIQFRKYSTASDVWSFGCVMYEIWSLGHKPFEAYDNVETIKMVDRGVRLPPPPGCPRELYRLMIECWHPKSSRRPSFAQLVEMLSQADFELLLWREEDTQIGTQVSVVGAPLEASKDLYSDLQWVYLP